MKHRQLLVVIQALLLAAPCFATNYWAEVFSYNTFDLEGKSVTFIPDTTYPGGYSVSMTNDLLWVDDSDAAHVGSMMPVTYSGYYPDQYKFGIVVTGSIPFYDTDYTTLYMNANGTITFNSGDDTLIGSIPDHFSPPRISLLFNYLYPRIGYFSNPDYGELTYKQDGDKVVITYRDFPAYWYSYPYLNTFQCVIYKNGSISQPPGTIIMSWQDINLYPSSYSDYQAIVGLSPGGGTPTGFVQSDISERAFDNDSDGILDAWELYWFGDIRWCVPTEDWDDDNVNQLDEYIGGTDPFDGNSVFKTVSSHTSSQITIGWQALEGRKYSIKWKQNLTDSVYNTLISNLTYPTSNYVINTTDDQRFYKVSVELQ